MIILVYYKYFVLFTSSGSVSINAKQSEWNSINSSIAIQIACHYTGVYGYSWLCNTTWTIGFTFAISLL